MKFFFGILLILSVGFSSCQENNQKQTFDWSSISPHLKDTLIFMENHGRIPNSVEGIAAKEPKEYSKVKWLRQKRTLKIGKHYYITTQVEQ
ncbi:MAG: putative membrane protein SirB2 [Paraglaciecola sp.]|jgi:uncharacterized membrane protein SirB2